MENSTPLPKPGPRSYKTTEQNIHIVEEVEENQIGKPVMMNEPNA